MDRSQYTIYPPTLTDTTGSPTSQPFRIHDTLVGQSLPIEAVRALQDGRYTIDGGFLTFNSGVLPATQNTEYSLVWILGALSAHVLRQSSRWQSPR